MQVRVEVEAGRNLPANELVPYLKSLLKFSRPTNLVKLCTILSEVSLGGVKRWRKWGTFCKKSSDPYVKVTVGGELLKNAPAQSIFHPQEYH